MSERMDPELVDALRDPELLRLAELLSSATMPEPPLDDAFKSALRRQLMEVAWKNAGGRNSWWRRVLAPQGMAWVGSAAVVVIVASVVVYTAAQPTGGFNQVFVQSPQQDAPAVALRQPIQVTFNQPMDHSSTEAAVQITPATTVTFTWSGDTTLYIQPTSGNLAPNTQYQVTIGPGAKTQTNNPITQPKTFTFVTQPTATPAPSPSPSPRNTSLLTGQQQLGSISSGTFYTPQWSADSATLYFVGGGGALEAVSLNGGAAKTLVPDGVSLPAIAPAGDRLAYVRNGKIEVLTLATATTAEVEATATVLTWVKDRLYWGSADGVFTLGPDGPVKLAASPDSSGGFVSIAPDGAHAVYGSASGLLVLDVATGKTSNLGAGGAGATFQGWSPNGSRLLYSGVIADMNGRTISALPPGDVSWSAKNELLVGSDTNLYELRPDGTDTNKLADGTYHMPVWAPDSTTFAFLRGTSLWAAAAPAPALQPPAFDQASADVTAFMQARLDNHPDRASSYLDDAGKAAYAAGNPALIPGGELGFRRFYILVAEQDPTVPNSTRVVVRMVFGHGKVERTSVEETLTLLRTQDTDPFVIDAVTVTAPRELGKGPEVVAVKVTATQVDVTFDSDLHANAVSGVRLVDSQGAPIEGTATYADGTVTFSGLQLTPGEHYRLVVLPSVQDVGNRNIASEYDLELIGPAPAPTSGGATPTPAPPTANPNPNPNPTPSPTPS